MHNNYSMDMMVNITKLKCCLTGIIAMYFLKFPFICGYNRSLSVV